MTSRARRATLRTGTRAVTPARATKAASAATTAVQIPPHDGTLSNRTDPPPLCFLRPNARTHGHADDGQAATDLAARSHVDDGSGQHQAMETTPNPGKTTPRWLDLLPGNPGWIQSRNGSADPCQRLPAPGSRPGEWAWEVCRRVCRDRPKSRPGVWIAGHHRACPIERHFEITRSSDHDSPATSVTSNHEREERHTEPNQTDRCRRILQRRGIPSRRKEHPWCAPNSPTGEREDSADIRGVRSPQGSMLDAGRKLPAEGSKHRSTLPNGVGSPRGGPASTTTAPQEHEPSSREAETSLPQNTEDGSRRLSAPARVPCAAR